MTISAITTSVSSVSTVTNTQVQNRISERSARTVAAPRPPQPVTVAPVDTYSYPMVSASPATSKLAAATWNIKGAE